MTTFTSTPIPQSLIEKLSKHKYGKSLIHNNDNVITKHSIRLSEFAVTSTETVEEILWLFNKLNTDLNKNNNQYMWEILRNNKSLEIVTYFFDIFPTNKSKSYLFTKHICENDPHIIKGIILHMKVKYNEEVLKQECMNAAALAGNIPSIEYLLSLGLKMTETLCYITVVRGNLNCLIYLHEHGCPWDHNTCITAARYRQLDCLIYAHTHQCPWNENCSIAAAGSSLECLIYVHKNGCPWNSISYTRAIANRRLDCFIYLYTYNCPFDELVIIYDPLTQELTDYINSIGGDTYFADDGECYLKFGTSA